MSPTLILYTGAGCHLCDQARVLIDSVLPEDWQLREVDIHSDPVLSDRYRLRIPVVAVDGEGSQLAGGELVDTELGDAKSGEKPRSVEDLAQPKKTNLASNDVVDSTLEKGWPFTAGQLRRLIQRCS